MSLAYPVITIIQDGEKFPKFVYETNDKENTLGAYRINLMNGQLNHVQTINFSIVDMPYGNRGPLGVATHINSNFVYTTDGGNLYTYSVNLSTGVLTQINVQSFGNRANDPTDQLIMHPSGKFLYTFNSPSTVFRLYDINVSGIPVYNTQWIFSNFIYNNLQHTYNDAVFRTKVDSFIQPVLSQLHFFTPIEFYKNKISYNEFTNQFYVYYLDKIENCQTTDVIFGIGGTTCSNNPSYQAHIYKKDLYDLDNSAGVILFNSTKMNNVFNAIVDAQVLELESNSEA